jgi:tetratricopeptide (TPR) repeat protein
MEFSRGLSLDPVSVNANMNAARPFYVSRDYQKAAEQLEKAIEIDVSFHRAHAMLAHCYTQMGRFDDAIAEARRAIELSHPKAEPGSPETNYQLAYIEARAGRTHKAQLLLESLDKLRGRTFRFIPAPSRMPHCGTLTAPSRRWRSCTDREILKCWDSHPIRPGTRSEATPLQGHAAPDWFCSVDVHFLSVLKLQIAVHLQFRSSHTLSGSRVIRYLEVTVATA